MVYLCPLKCFILGIQKQRPDSLVPFVNVDHICYVLGNICNTVILSRPTQGLLALQLYNKSRAEYFGILGIL